MKHSIVSSLKLGSITNKHNINIAFNRQNKQICKYLFKIGLINSYVINTDSNNIIIYFSYHERVYTKLKYWRVPIYDSVSGGLACLFAGFLGFLISERFGYELVDSGDIYYFYMYIVLFCIACRIYIYSWWLFQKSTIKFFYLPIYLYIKNIKYW